MRDARCDKESLVLMIKKYPEFIEKIVKKID